MGGFAVKRWRSRPGWAEESSSVMLAMMAGRVRMLRVEGERRLGGRLMGE